MDADTARARSLRLVQGDVPPQQTDEVQMSVPREALHALDRSDSWELDAVPVPMQVEGEVAGRSCVRMLVANGFVLDIHLDAAPPSEPEEVARMLVEWMLASVARHRAMSGAAIPMPDYLLVRHASVARAMAPMLLPETRVQHSHLMPEIDRAASALRTRLDMAASEPEPEREFGEAPGMDVELPDAIGGISLISFPEIWRAWNIPDAELDALFTAAAEFYTAAPWTRLENEETLAIGVPADAADGAAPWTACVMGAGGEEFGLVLYERDSDFMRLLSEQYPEDMLRGVEGAVITMYFDPRSALPRAMQLEFKQHRWPVANANAYPLLSCANTPAGGISRAQVSLLTRALGAIARMTAVPDLLPAEKTPRAEPIVWHDAVSGLSLAYRGSRAPSAVRLWDVPVILVSGNASGPGADRSATFPRDVDSEEALDAVFEPEIARLDAFAAWLEQSRGERLRARGGGSSESHLENARLFVEHLAFGHGVTLRAVHEYHLRIFLYDWIPSRIPRADREIAGIVASLRKLFAWMETEGIVCAWALPILDDRTSLDARIATCPAGIADGTGPLWWSDQLSDDLHRRVMLPDPLLHDDGHVYEDGMIGPREMMLYDEVVALNLGWREATIASGQQDPALVRAACREAQRQWESQKHPRYGKSPASVIRQERRKPHRN